MSKMQHWTKIRIRMVEIKNLHEAYTRQCKSMANPQTPEEQEAYDLAEKGQVKTKARYKELQWIMGEK